MMNMDPSLSSSTSKQEKQCLGWVEWFQGWFHLLLETFFEKFMSRHLPNPLPLPPLNGVTCIVTGSTSGIGLEIARQLAMSGAHVVMAVRNPAMAHKLIQMWQDESSSQNKILKIDVMELNLLSLESVVRFSEEWNSKSIPLNILINNAGLFAMGKPQEFSKDGYEVHMQVNHLAPALLSLLLLPSLKKGKPSRIINVNSLMHAVGIVKPSDMNMVSKETKFTGLRAYSSSKLAQLMFSSVLQQRIPANAGISVVCADPGSVRTNVARDLPTFLQIGFRMLLVFLFTSQEGSRSALYAATDAGILDYCGKLKAKEWPVCAYVGCNCKTMVPSKEAHNLGTRNVVWKKTLDMVGLDCDDAVEKLLEGEEIQCKYGAK